MQGPLPKYINQNKQLSQTFFDRLLKQCLTFGEKLISKSDNSILVLKIGEGRSNFDGKITTQ